MGELDKAIETHARLLAYHSRNNSMGTFYDLYPEERPKSAAYRELAQNIAATEPSPGQEARQQERDGWER